MHFRRFSPIVRKYPIFELVDGEAALLDISKIISEVLRLRFITQLSQRYLICTGLSPSSKRELNSP
jgi:hypothetical protein